MYKALVCFVLCRNPSPCAASFAGGSKPSSPSIFYKLWHRDPPTQILPWVLQNDLPYSLHSPSQRNNNGGLSLPLIHNRGRFIQTTKWRGSYGIPESLFRLLILQA